MSTTQLFAELLVSGTGVVIWLAFLLAWRFQISIQDLTAGASISTLAPVIAIAYVLGIVIDRLGFSMLHGLEKRLRKDVTGIQDEQPMQDQEMYVRTNSPELGQQINYNRSRLRICRSWTINFMMIAISSALWAYAMNPATALYLPLASLVLCIATFLVWSRLVVDHYRNIQTTYNYLKMHRSSKRQKS